VWNGALRYHSRVSRDIPFRIALAIASGGTAMAFLAAACGPSEGAPPQNMQADAGVDGALPDSAGGGDATAPARTRITFDGVGPVGVFDPSLASADGEARVWMAYSEVLPSPMWPTQNVHVVHTRIARSDDEGATFTDVGVDATTFRDVDLAPLLAPPLNAGTWIAEVSSLVWDQGAPAAERWRLAFMHYLQINGVRHFEHGWLGLKTAATPEGLAAAVETKLLVGTGYDSGNDVAGGASKSPLGGAPIIHLDTLHPDLAGCTFAEPSLFSTATSLELALLCAKSDTDRRIVRVTCARPCAPTSPTAWSYAGTLLTSADASALGYDRGFSAPALVRTASGGRALLVTPSKSTPFPDFYDGCVGYPLTATGALQGSARSPAFSAPGTPSAFRGACDYSPKAARAGVLLSELAVDQKDSFRLYATHIELP
jgi:hypothetical protein